MLKRSEDIKNLEVYKNVMPSLSKDGQWCLNHYVLEPLAVGPDEGWAAMCHFSSTSCLGHWLMCYSLHDAGHKNFRDYDEDIKKIKEAFEGINEGITKICDVFLTKRDGSMTAYEEIREIANDDQYLADWAA